MRRAAVLGAGAALALAALAMTSAGETAAPGDDADAGPMPDFLGQRLWRVFTHLPRRIRLDVHDVSGQDRRVLWPSNWLVCTQYPATGTGLDRRTTVMIGVVRRGESCPPRVAGARR
ncbi:hypothetical protein ACGFYZ_32815 [Streptomyces sp. NPDC048330]|uniref:hypothetical protein n=1 Tax=Streptomyces sp. NPDC048330 TaxID=3365533 RepID=UPI0037182F3C